jgi:hypothetical protein
MSLTNITDFLVDCPTFRLTYNNQTIVINEYALRTVQLHIKNKKVLPSDIVVVDGDGAVVEFRPDGIIKNEPKGMDTNTMLAYALIRKV